MGHAKFRFDILARQGTLILIPYPLCRDLEYIKHRLQVATGLPLLQAFGEEIIIQ